MRAVMIGLMAAVLGASAAAQPRVRQGTRMPEADPTLPEYRHRCAIEVGGLVHVDGKLGAWRDDFCGPITLPSRPWRCEENRALKLRRLIWSEWFWVYVRLAHPSPTVERYCPDGIRTGPAGAPVWSVVGPRADDFLLTPKRRKAAALD